MRLSLNVDQETFDSAGRAFEPVPVGDYTVSIFEIKPDEVKTGGNKGKPRLKFQFKIVEGETAPDGSNQANRRLFADLNAFDGVSTKTGLPTPPYDLVAIGKAIGLSIEEIKEADTDDWLGEELQVSVEHEEKKTKESGYTQSFVPPKFREKVRGFRSLTSVATSVAASAAATGKAPAAAKAKAATGAKFKL